MKYEMNSLICGDSFDLIKDLDDNIFDLTITSPSYFNLRKYSSPNELGREKELDDYLDSLTKIFKECLRVTSETGSVVFNVGDKYDNGNLMLIPYRFAQRVQAETGAKLINVVMWCKTNPTPRQCNRRLVPATEPFFHFVKGGEYKYFYERLSKKSDLKPKPNSKIGLGYFDQIEQSDLTPEQKRRAINELAEVIDEVREGKIDSLRMKIKGIHAPAFGGQDGGRATQMEKNGYTIIRVPGNSMVKDWIDNPVETIRGIGHLAIYPCAMVEKFIHLTTEPGDSIFDPFVGSGTSAYAAKKTGREYMGFDLSEDYIKRAKERLEKMDPTCECNADEGESTKKDRSIQGG